MNNEALLKAKENIRKVADASDVITLNTEVIENFTLLIDDKLQNLRNLREYMNDPKALLLQVFDITRYSRSYISLSYCITDKLNKINNEVREIQQIIKDTRTLPENIKPLEEKKGVQE